VQVIPIDKYKPFAVQRRTFDGIKYTLHIEWNMRAGWFLGLSDADDLPIFDLRKLVTESDLLAGYRHDERCPPGKLFLVDTTGLKREPGYEDLVAGASESDLQGTHALVYVEATET
jgi:hypothetical protein